MHVGFLAWNTFQVGHFAQIMRQFDSTDVIFSDKNPAALDNFDPQWLTQCGANSRFVTETKLASLDGQYDAILTQFAPPLHNPWQKTKLIMTQYSLAKPKTAYSERWLAADGGLVYGNYSEQILEKMCPVIKAGNSRFDPYFADTLDTRILARLSAMIDPSKRTILFLPTWGDLSSGESFSNAIDELSRHFNVLYKPHHISGTDPEQKMIDHTKVIDINTLTDVLDLGPYLMKVADLVISDMSGAIFDGLYCRKPVVLMGLNVNFDAHKKAEPTALEIAHTDRIGPVVKDPCRLVETVENMLARSNPYEDANEKLVKELFVQRGDCAALAAEGLTQLIKTRPRHHDLQAYAGPTMKPLILRRAHMYACKRAVQKRTLAANKRAAGKQSNSRGTLSLKKIASSTKGLLLSTARYMPSSVLSGGEKIARRVGFSKGERYLSARTQEAMRRESSGDLDDWLERYQVVAAPGEPKLPKSKASKAKMLKGIIDNGTFFDLGYLVERWTKGSSHASYSTTYPFYCAASNLRFSRRQFAGAHEALKNSANNPFFMTLKVRRSILRDMGFLTEALKVGNKLTDVTQDKLRMAADLLGPEIVYLERAADNETLPLEDQHVCRENGEWTTLKQANGRILELSIVLGFARVVAEEGRANREAMMEVTRKIIHALRQQGWTILPRLQAGYAGAVPITGKFPSITWHTTNTGVPQQLHLKVGSYSQHIILDGGGYSGWASLANIPLAEIIHGIDQEDANAHFDHLRASLVETGLSKFKQSDDPLPEADRYIFLPMQVSTDTVAALAHIEGLDLLNMMISWSETNNTTLVVKRHPRCNSPEIRAALDQAVEDGKIVETNASIHGLVAGADAVVTVNSGVGAEALLHLKPVITTGGSDYAAATVFASNQKELYAALDGLRMHPISDEDIKAFLWVYTKKFQLHPEDSAAITERLSTLLPVESTGLSQLHPKPRAA